ncbi:hypothetical protein Tco_0255363 [Tanacetum coccineum]
MPKATTTDISLTKSYILKVSKIPGISPTIAKFYKSIENRNIHEGRVVDQAYYKSNNIEHLFTNIRFDCLFQINEPIVPRFILYFYSQVTVQTDEYGYLVISFMIQHEFITLTLAQFGQILKIPYNGQAVFTNEWDLASLEYSQETEGPYCTELPTPDDIRRLLELERVMVDRRTSGPSPACLLNIVVLVFLPKQQYNLANFFVKRIECAKATPTTNLPYGMFLTCLYRHVMESYPHLDNGIYDIVERARRSVLSSSSHHQGTSSHQHDDDDDDVETSRANLTQDDTKTPSPKLQLSSPSAPNAPSKTPSTKDTSSSSIDYIPKSPTSSTSLSPNGYLNPPTSPPLRVSPPPLTQENALMDITLTLSPITPLDVQFDTPSPSPPIFGHPIP